VTDGGLCASFARKASSTRRSATRAELKLNVAGAGADRPLWWPGKEAPAHLDGSMTGDYGCDPFSLSVDPEMRSWMVQAELQHCRWAMLGFLGAVGAELMTKEGLIDAPQWFEAGAGTFFTDGWTLVGIQMLLMSWAEGRRWMDMTNPGSVNADPLFGADSGYVCTGSEVGYPGGKWFDPLGMTASKDKYEELKLKEIKNGRLAMVAWIGLAAQASATKEGPLDNWIAHIQSPSAENLFQTIYK
jgi:light-harvesting complex I chlorophyll a/b binding protein 2